MGFDYLYHPYLSKRRVIFAKNGMVATSQYLAAQAGLEILKQGGNAIDAAIASAACLTVVEPTSNGIGGDAFAIVWFKEKMYGLNASGPAPMAISGEILKENGYKKIPDCGWIPVTVPGVPAAWAELNKKFGRLPLSKNLLPAINYAREGFPVSPLISNSWKQAYHRYSEHKNKEVFSYWFNTFAPNNKAPEPGELWRLAEQAKTLQLIADSEAKAFYQGELAEKIDSFSKKYNGYLCLEDLKSFSPEWVEPISINYHGYQVWEIPPNGQGLVTLLALNILKQENFFSKDAADVYHYQIEAIKLAFLDCKKIIADYQQISSLINDILSERYAAEKNKIIGEEAFDYNSDKPSGSDTVYLATADSEGNMVSYIQSNYMGFGSGLVVPETGISLQNRGISFSLDSSHVNYLKPGKRPYHTIIPGFLTKENKAIGPFGIKGGFMQPQGHVQIIMNMIDFNLNPQAALDAPRWQWIEGKKIKVEKHFPENIGSALKKKGHNIEVSQNSDSFGIGQIIWKENKKVLAGATDPRADGVVAAW